MNSKRRRLIWLAGIFSLFGGCGALNQNATEFEWYATESAPEHYPMEIIRGTFYYKDQDNGLYIPSGGTLYAGWGNKNSLHAVGSDKKPLPDRVEVTFYSYAEKQFYRGDFELPYDRILALFQEAYRERPERPYYKTIMLGIAPGGVISVWLGGGRTTEVFFGQADKVDIEPSMGFNLPFDSKEESDTYIEKQLVNVLKPEELESLKNNGIPFGTWARYRNLYKWIPSYTENKLATDKRMSVDYLNGESDWAPTYFPSDVDVMARPLPRNISFSVNMGDESVLYIIHFEEFELMEAFEKLGANGEKVYLEFDPQLPRPNTKVRVRNYKEIIDLKKTVTEDW